MFTPALGAHPASYTMYAKESFCEGKVAKVWSSPSTPSSVRVNNWNYTSTPCTNFMVWAKTTSHFFNYDHTVSNTEFRTWQIFLLTTNL
jgi:hypothetical protein